MCGVSGTTALAHYYYYVFVIVRCLCEHCQIMDREKKCVCCHEMDHLHYRLNFDLNTYRQKFYHSLKERHKISNIPKFRCEML